MVVKPIVVVSRRSPLPRPHRVTRLESPCGGLRRHRPGQRPTFLPPELIKGPDRAARRRASKAMNRLLAQLDEQSQTETGFTLAEVVEEWLRLAEIDYGTREMYRGHLNRNIRPVIGNLAIEKITGHTLELFYGDLPRCRLP